MFKTPPIPGVPREGGGRKHPPPRPRKPAVVLQPDTYRHLQRGVNLIAEAVRPTLGPLPRLVMLEGLRPTDRPELLDNAATIGRRIIAIEPRGSDVGAMLIRQALWRMHTDAGDGAATMAVMYQVVFNEGVRCVTGMGANPMLLREGLERGLQAVLAWLGRQATPVTRKDDLAGMALGLCQGDRALADLLAEVFDIVGADGLIVVEKWNRAGLDREYIEGTYWHLSGWFSRWLVDDKTEHRVMFEDAALLISDLKLTQPQQVIPALERCVQAGVKRLVIIAAEVSDSVIGLLVQNNRANSINTVAVRTPRVGEQERAAAMEDIALLSGGRPLHAAAGDSLNDLRVDDLGRARRAWATESLFGIYGGKGDPRRLRQHLAHLRSQLRLAETEVAKRNLQQRLGRVAGGTAIVRVGGHTTTEVEARKAVAERAVTTLRAAVQGGVVAGGGAALLAARVALDGLAAHTDEDTLAYRILARALEEPLRTIARNAGAVPDIIAEKVKQCAPGTGFDARTHALADLGAAGVLDPVVVLQKAVEVAVSGAATALTTDVIVHHKQPKESLEP